MGCNGNANKDGFTFCKSCNNYLIDVTSLEETKRDKVIDFLDKVGNLFSGPIENNNKAFNVINYLYRDFSLFEKELILNIQKFFLLHKECGIYLALVPESP